MNDLIFQNKLLKEGLNDSNKSNDSKTKENNELRNEIKKLKEAKVRGSNIIDDLTKSYKDSSTLPKMLQDVRKKDDKTRTFAPPDKIDELDKKMKYSAEETLALTNLLNLKKLDGPKETTYVYDSINLNDVNNLSNEIKMILLKMIIL